MARNRPLLTWASQRWDFVSPRARRQSGKGPVLAIWPDPKVVELAERMALDTTLCVIAGSHDISPWVQKAHATCLVEGYEAELVHLPPDVCKSLDSMLFLGGSNGFLGGGEKEDAIRRLREMAQRSNRPSPEAIESYLLASGKTHAKGAERATLVRRDHRWKAPSGLCGPDHLRSRGDEGLVS